MTHRSNDTIIVINEHLMKATVFSLSLLGLGAVVCAFGGRRTVHFAASGFDVEIHSVDILFVIALIVIYINAFTYYKKVLCEVGESANDSLVSLLGMLVMFAMAVVLFFNRMFQYRFLILALFSFAVLQKNNRLRKSLAYCALGARFLKWYRQARYSTILAVVAAVLFLMMFDPRINHLWLPAFIDGNDVHFTQEYYDYAPGAFYLFFVLHACKLFLTDGDYFGSDEYDAEIAEARR
jgi:hypothetical protein